MPAMDLTEFLLARIAEDEGPARAAAESKGAEWEIRLLMDGHGLVGSPRGAEGMPVRMWPEVAYHVARWDPAHVLAECEAKRRIITAASWDDEPWRRTRDYLLELLALPYADHPDFDEAWRP